MDCRRCFEYTPTRDDICATYYVCHLCPDCVVLLKKRAETQWSRTMKRREVEDAIIAFMRENDDTRYDGEYVDKEDSTNMFLFQMLTLHGES